MSETVVSELATSPIDPIERSREKSEGRASENDSRSSSLSELEYGIEGRDGTPNRVYKNEQSDENDSEAETEKLEITPRKQARSDIILPSHGIHAQSPSKLSSQIPLTSSPEEESPEPRIGLDASVGAIINGDESRRGTSQPASIISGRLKDDGPKRLKRKRSERSSSTSSSEGSLDETSAQNTVSTRAKAQSVSVQVEGRVLEDKLIEDDDAAKDDDGPLEVENEEEEDNNVLETTNSRSTRTKKGKRKGKKRRDDSGQDVESNVLIDAVTGDDGNLATETATTDGVEEDGTVNNEEAQKKDAAFSSLGAVEAQFAEFRSKLFDDRIAQLSHELQLLRQPVCEHPEYLAQLRCIDERRKERINYENTLLQYKQRALNVRLHAEHSQIHSQYFQEIRDVRDKALERCGKFLYDIQKGRRRWAMNEVDYTYMYQPKRSKQLQQQAAYNLEVSLLSGIAKYVGFPSAPEMKGAKSSEVEDDFRNMRIMTYQAVPVPHAQNEPARLAQASAEERFLEQTPWANPQHPAHNSRVHVRSSTQTPRFASNLYMTPAAQQRRLDAVGAPNGSASTVEMPSNPPSSAAAIPISASSDAARMREADKSPVPQQRNGSFSKIHSKRQGSAIEPHAVAISHNSTKSAKPPKSDAVPANAFSSMANVHSAVQPPTVDMIPPTPTEMEKELLSSPTAPRRLSTNHENVKDTEVPSPSRMRMSNGLTGLAVEAKVW